MYAVRTRTAPALLHALLSQGFTAKPVCPQCQQARAPKDFTAAGICRACVPAAAAVTLVGWLPCPGNNCGDGQELKLVRQGGVVQAASYPNHCQSCGTVHHMTPEYSQDELRAAWVEAEEAL